MRIKNLFFMPALIACLGSMPAGRVAAQTFTTLHKFTGGSDGGNPWAALTLSGNTLYGTTYDGGNSGSGIVFAIKTDGRGFTNLHSFSGGSDGANPFDGMILSSNTLYGTAYGGGDSGAGTMFAINTDGTGFTNLHSFRGGSDGANPFDGLILSGSTLYGTAAGGGSSGKGTVFAVNTNGTGFTNLHNFNGSDGSYPMAGLILSGNTLYGTTEGGASYGFGALFAINTDGTGFTNLHNFNANLNSDGGDPADGLVIFGNTLYGTTSYGGSSGKGTVFKVNTDGTGFTNLHSFAGYPSDGTGPLAGLFLSGNTLYGAGQYGGSSNDGTVFAINTDGTGFTNLFSFTGASDGEYPLAGLILSGNTLYGTAYGGGPSGYGTVFSLSFAPQLTIIHSGDSVILNWPTNNAGFDYTGYTLQSTTNLVSPVWTNVFPGPVVFNGQNTVTNPISGASKFYRLSL